MIKPRLLAPLFLALAMGTVPLRAQPAPAEPAGSPAPPTTGTGDQVTPAGPTPAAQEPAQKSPPPTTGVDSPFDYRPSEEISEDLPVSFPVDI